MHVGALSILWPAVEPPLRDSADAPPGSVEGMNARLVLSDPAAATDLLTFASRAAALDEPLVRLQAAEGVLIATAAALAPASLIDATPTVLGMRVSRVDPEVECDLVIAADELAAGTDAEIVLPERGRRAAWAGISPPRGGWAPLEPVSIATLRDVAERGIAVVAREAVPGLGEDLVRRIRARVWGEGASELGGLPAGVAFAATALGFFGAAATADPAADAAATPAAASGQARVWASGPWTRIALPGGHVLTRARTTAGLTAVRRTGNA